MTSVRFDLLTEQWLPVTAGDQTLRVGLRELFERAHEFDDLAVPVPPAASGLWRILYAITARVTGLDNSDNWVTRQADWLSRGRFDVDKIEAYFEKYRNAFDLFHPDRPWMQDPRLAVECPKSSKINKLVFDRPAGNTQVWFGHFTDDEPVPLPTAEAAWYLVAQLYYGASGRCTSREVRGQKFANTSAGPLRSAMSYHPLGRNLFESLILGVPQQRAANDAEDLCPWERNELPDPLGVPYEATWPGGLLTAQFRHAVLLVPGEDGRTVVDAYVTWAWRQPPFEVRDPYVIYKVSKQGNPYQMQADGSRALWRDVYALLMDHPDSQRPDIVGTAGVHDYEGQQRIRAYGFHQDGQAKDHQWFAGVTPPILRWLQERDEEAAYGVGDVYKAAERVGDSLNYVMWKLWEECNNTEVKSRDKVPWARAALSYYWSHAEEIFWRHLHDRTFDLASKAFKELGHEAIDWVMDGKKHLPRIAAGVATAHRRLGASQK